MTDSVENTSPVSEPPQHYQVLARKYRPRTFDDLIGQDVTVRILRNAFNLHRVAHAFMLTGVRGVGKTTSARIIARALNCVGPDGNGEATADPCGVCHNCKAILADRHPDVLEIDAASHTGVDDVREIIEAARFKPLQGRMKVFIIDEVHMLSRNAFNALLKTLEEPPAQVTFIFATTELRKVPVTVLSRCQRFDMRRVSQEKLADHFAQIAVKENVAITADALAIIARAADGSVRDGLSLLDQAIAQAPVEKGQPISAEQVTQMLGQADRSVVFDVLEAVFAGEPAKMLATTERAYQNGVDLGLLLADMLDVLHMISRLQVIESLRESRELSELERVRGTALALALPVPALARAWQIILKGLAEVETAPDRRAAAEMVLLRLCYVADLPMPADLVKNIKNNQFPAEKQSGADISSVKGGSYGRDSQPTQREALQNMPERGISLSPQARQIEATPIQNYSGNANMSSLHEGEFQPNYNGNAAPSYVHEVDLSDSSALPTLKRPLQTWREIVSFIAELGSEKLLHGHLRHSVHVVRCAPPVLEIRVEPAAPKDLAQKLRTILHHHTSQSWSVVISSLPGEPTLAEQEVAQGQVLWEEVKSNPLVQSILKHFPGAVVKDIKDQSLDAYGLPPEILDMDEREAERFAPLESELVDEEDLSLPDGF